MGRRGPVPAKVIGAEKEVQVAAPKPKPVRPRCPKYLPAVARKEWRRVVPELERLGLLTCVDGAALEAYCLAYSDMVKAQETLEEEGLTFTTDKGYVGQHPAVAMKNKAMAALKSMAVEFGLTPAGRERMKVSSAQPEAEDEMEKFLRGGG